MPRHDVMIIGAGAAGLFCAARAGQRGLSVLLVDHSPKLAEKLRISGGGRCNFTNRDAGPANFLSENPHFCRSALARYTPTDFITLVQRHRIAFHEKHKGQLFCDESSEQIVDMLLRECEAGRVERWQPCGVHEVRAVGEGGGFEVQTDRGTVQAMRLVIATGGLSIPKIGASDFAYRIARQFGHRIVETRPALVPLTFTSHDWLPLTALAGLSLPVRLHNEARGPARGEFLEDLLFTHRGLSGPAVLQISSYWRPGQALVIDLAPELELAPLLRQAKATSRRQLGTELALHLPQRLTSAWLDHAGMAADTPMPQMRDRDLEALATSLHAWRVMPAGSEGYRKAEVTAGGVDTKQLEQQSMQSRLQPGLHFIGEAVDVTGWLGGYNFQWAWASAAACADAL